MKKDLNDKQRAALLTLTADWSTAHSWHHHSTRRALQRRGLVLLRQRGWWWDWRLTDAGLALKRELQVMMHKSVAESCSFCQQYSRDLATGAGGADICAACAAEAHELLGPGWFNVNVSDRLPEKGMWLVYGSSETGPPTMRVDEYDGEWGWTGPLAVTHWRALPAAPPCVHGYQEHCDKCMTGCPMTTLDRPSRR
jgi:hypothetical protein